MPQEQSGESYEFNPELSCQLMSELTSTLGDFKSRYMFELQFLGSTVREQWPTIKFFNFENLSDLCLGSMNAELS